MELNLITHWTPPSGRLVEWTVSDHAARVAAEAAIDPALPSTIQERHLRRAAVTARTSAAQSPWIGMAFEIEGPLDSPAMTRAIETYLHRHETFASWFSFEDPDADPTDAGNPIRRHVVPAEGIELEPRIIDEHASSEQIRKHVEHRFATGTSALSWPAFVFGAVEHDTGSGEPGADAARFTVFHAVDHAHTDAQSMLLTFAELRTLYLAEVSGTPAELPDAGSFVEFSQQEQERAKALTLASPQVTGWLSHLAEHGGTLPSFPLDLGVEDGPRPAVGSRFDLADPVQSARFTEVAAAHGGNAIGAWFAALAIVEHELAGRDRYLGLTPVGTRGTDFAWSQGWFINVIPVSFGLDGATSFSELASRAREAYRGGRALADVSVHRVIDMVLAAAGDGASVAPSTLSVPPIVSYLDVHRLPLDAATVAASHITGLVGGKDTSIVSMWINQLHDSTWIALSHPDTPAAHDSVSRYAERLGVIIRTVADTGDYTIGKG